MANMPRLHVLRLLRLADKIYSSNLISMYFNHFQSNFSTSQIGFLRYCRACSN